MPQDLCLNTTPKANKPVAPLTVLVAALMATIAMIGAKDVVSTTTATTKGAAPMSQDWHGNVMRSQWVQK